MQNDLQLHTNYREMNGFNECFTENRTFEHLESDLLYKFSLKTTVIYILLL